MDGSNDAAYQAEHGAGIGWSGFNIEHASPRAAEEILGDAEQFGDSTTDDQINALFRESMRAGMHGAERDMLPRIIAGRTGRTKDELQALWDAAVREYSRAQIAPWTQIVTANVPLLDLDSIRAGKWRRNAPPARRWLLENCLPMGKVGLIVAPGGTGKSRLICQLAVAIATGETFAGGWKIGEQGAVLALFAEEDEDELHRRFWQVGGAMNATPEILDERVFVGSMTGLSNLMTVRESGGDVRETDYADRVIALANKIENLKLIVIDPLSRFRGGEENAAEDTTRFVAVLERISKQTGATVIGVHHTNKASANGEEANQHASRGSSALTDGVRWQMNLSVMSRKEAKGLGVPDEQRRFHVKITITKNNYAPPPKTGDVWLENDLQSGLLRPAIFVRKNAHGERKIKDKMADLVWDGAERGEEYSKTDFINKFGGVTKALQVSEKVSERLLEECLDEKSLILRKPIQGRRGVTEVLAVHDVDAAARRVNAEADAYRRASRGA